MSDKQVFLDRPRKESLFGFYMRAWAILAEAETINPFIGVLDVPPDAPAQDAALIRRHNRHAERHHARTAERIGEDLVRLGFPAERLQAPEMQARLSSFATCEIAALHHLTMSRPEPREERDKRTRRDRARAERPGYPKAIAAEAIQGASLYHGGKRGADLAEILNAKPWPSAHLRGEHVNRGLERFKRMLTREMQLCSRAAARAGHDPRALPVALGEARYDAVRERFHALERIRASAAMRDEFKGLRGADLADAIHARHDLFRLEDKIILGPDAVAA